MEVFQTIYQNTKWSVELPTNSQAQLVLVFGSKALIETGCCREILLASFTKAEIIACSTSGEILGGQIYDDSLCVTAITFKQTFIQVYSDNIQNFSNAQVVGHDVASRLQKKHLKHVLLFADGQKVNCSALLEGLEDKLSKSVAITGGLAADGSRFEQTWLWHNAKTESGMIIVCGLYGNHLDVGHGCFGGWDVFGPDRLITKSEDNVLYELDGGSALALYKRYLGDYVKDLPSSALLFPLYVHSGDEKDGVVRTILNVDEQSQSMTFAGELEEGQFVQLMHGNFDRLVDGAEVSAKAALSQLNQIQPSFGLLISCVGRRLALNQRVDEELEAVTEVIGEHVPTCGFYSYGEISPMKNKHPCVLHNQTMTITVFSETNA